jgi:hypothetical protein
MSGDTTTAMMAAKVKIQNFRNSFHIDSRISYKFMRFWVKWVIKFKKKTPLKSAL